MKKKLYMISGLGADKRAFQNLDLTEFEPVHLKWIKPMHKESLASYARRLAQKIDDPRPVIVGLSFGGMLATEMSKFLDIEKLILISTAKTMSEMPSLYRLSAKLNLHKVLSLRLLTAFSPIISKLIGTQSKKERDFSKQLLTETNHQFLTWAVDAIVNWQNIQKPKQYFHIHGDCDYLFPIRNIDCQYIIKGGTHIMVVNRAKEMSDIIKGIMSS